MNVSELSTRMKRALIELALQQEGPAVSPDQERVNEGTTTGHGIHLERSRRPTGNSRPEAVIWAERILRVVELAENAAAKRGDARTRTAEPKQVVVRRMKARMAEYAGHPPEYVALLENCPAEWVREARHEVGRDRVFGELWATSAPSTEPGEADNRPPLRPVIRSTHAQWSEQNGAGETDYYADMGEIGDGTGEYIDGVYVRPEDQEAERCDDGGEYSGGDGEGEYSGGDYGRCDGEWDTWG